MTPRAVLTEALAALYSGANEADADALLDQLADMGHTVVRSCAHESSDGVDDTPLDDPRKVWRCHECGALHQFLPGPAASAAPPVGAGSIGDRHTAGQPPAGLSLGSPAGTSLAADAPAAATARGVESGPSTDPPSGVSRYETAVVALCRHCDHVYAITFDLSDPAITRWFDDGAIVRRGGLTDLVDICDRTCRAAVSA